MAGDAADDRRLAVRRALALLARREHSRQELRRKLTAGGHPSALVTDVVAELAARGVQSEERFIAGFIRSATARGQGPLKVRAGLLRRGVAVEQADAGLDAAALDWRELAEQALLKRFGPAPGGRAAELGRRGRFLTGRGFPTALVATLLGEADTC